MSENCPKCGYPDKNIYQPNHPCSNCGQVALEIDLDVNDPGRHKRLSEPVKEGIKETIHTICKIFQNAGLEVVADMCTKQVIDYLELPPEILASWYQEKD